MNGDEESRIREDEAIRFKVQKELKDEQLRSAGRKIAIGCGTVILISIVFGIVMALLN